MMYVKWAGAKYRALTHMPRLFNDPPFWTGAGRLISRNVAIKLADGESADYIRRMIHQIVAFIGQHAIWAGPIMFAVSFGESFAFASLLFPGTAIMIAAGALVPSGTLDAWPLLIGCITGATSGDAVSYWLGRRYGHLVERVWPFTRHPQLLVRGFAFFERHGGKSVFIGRFFGPLRAVIPLVAGITKMRPARFWIANILSALVWAPALLLPGALIAMFVRTLHVARDVEWLLLALLVALIVGAIWAAKKSRFFARYTRF